MLRSSKQSAACAVQRGRTERIGIGKSICEGWGTRNFWYSPVEKHFQDGVQQHGSLIAYHSFWMDSNVRAPESREQEV